MVDCLVFFVLMHGNGLAENVFLLFIQGVHKLVHFAKAFCDALELGRPVIIDTIIDKDEFVLPMLPPGGSIDDIIVDKEEAEK